MNNFDYVPPKNSPVSDAELLKDLRAIANKAEKSISQSAYVSNGGKYNPSTILRRFGTWNRALAKIGLSPVNVMNYSDEELFEYPELKSLVDALKWPGLSSPNIGSN